MSPQRAANITAAVIFILLAAGHQIPASSGQTVLQGTVHQQVVGQKVVKLTCSSSCSGNCFYDWYSRYWLSTYLGCSSIAEVWIDSTSSSNEDRYSCWVKNYDKSPLDCELGEKQWGVTYTPDSVCALEGSSVDLSCSYKHPGGLRVTESFWFINEQRVDLLLDDQYKRRVQYHQTKNQNQLYHTVRITDLKASDAQTYKFRFITDDPLAKFAGRSGVSLSVTGLKIEVSDTRGGGKMLNCSSTCTLTNPTYIWYRNGQPVSEQNRAVLYLRDRTVDAGSYSCAVKEHEEIRSAAVCGFEGLQVKVEGAAAAPVEEQTVTLTCSLMCSSQSYSIYTWYRNIQPVSECRSSSCSVAVVRGEISYSCAVEGRDLSSASVCEFRFSHSLIYLSVSRLD
uniref:Ig-like domain-containing protein n=1 Tax=Astyanax mexicanus TaxID=7994 RepID=A0A3B1KK28_ASTMX